jgi:hypothetical protein
MIHPILRSTTQRLLTTWKPRISGLLETTSTSIPRLAPCSITAFLKPVSTQVLDMVGMITAFRRTRITDITAAQDTSTLFGPSHPTSQPIAA